MNQDRLFVAGQLQYRDLSLSQALSGGAQIQFPSNASFISHQSNDKDAAEKVAVFLSSRGYPCYLDTFDPNVDGDGPELESYLRRVIALCNSLMAMVSRTTRTSWWVPLEIGVALEKEKHIATYLLTSEGLPSYLWQWPMLRRGQDALQWAQDTQRETAAEMNKSWRMRNQSEKLNYVR
jgi:hypothetical protein